MALLEQALAYHAQGFCVIPCILTELDELKPDGTKKVNKQPVVAWKKYQEQRPSRSLVEEWFGHKYKNRPDVQIGALTGAAHGFFAVDLDVGWSEEDIKRYDIDTRTRTVRTPSGGFHYHFKHPGGSYRTITDSRVLEHIDVRGDGGFVVLPPSHYPDGRPYTWVGDQPLLEPSKKLLELVEDKRGKKYERVDYSDVIDGLVPPGRTDAAISIAGALIAYQPEHQWDNLCWPLVYLWNERNIPPLERQKLRKDFIGICAKERSKRMKKEI